MVSKSVLIFLATVVIGALRLFGQMPDYHLQVFGHSFGIRPGNYIAVTRDTRGFVWILYPRNIQRFDGKRIT
jgi:hypothetical protein